jgi:ketosteroid isomerase-like protein
MDADALIRESKAAYTRQDWDALRRLYHPSAVIVSVVGGERRLSRDELVDLLADAASDLVYRATSTHAETIDEEALIVVGRVRHRTESGGFQDSAYVWLWTLRDDLIYRSVAYPSSRDARAAYAELGVMLALPDA